MSFVTSDIQLAAYLAATGHTVARVEGPRDRRQFVFADAVPQAEVDAYYAGSGPVPPRELFHHYRALKARLFQPGDMRDANPARR